MYQYAWIVLDLFAVLIFLHTINHCATRGFLRTVINFFGYIVASMAARMFCGRLGELLYRHLGRDILRLVLTRQLEGALAEGATGLSDAVPQFLQRIMQGTGRELLQSAFDGDVSAMVDLLIDVALEDPVLLILESIAFFLIFSVMLWVVRRFSSLFSGVYRIPLIGTANTVLGGVVGVFEACVILYLVAVGIQLVIYLSGNELPFLNRQVLDSTYVYRIFFRL